MKKLYIILLLQSFTSLKAQKVSEFKLYENKVPNSIISNIKENSTFEDGITRIANVSMPTLTVYKPAHPNGMGIIICPGGGYSILAFDYEGINVAKELNKWGITAFVLKYRLPDNNTMIDKSTDRKSVV